MNEETEIGMKRTNLDALSAHYRIADYKELYKKVMALIDSRKIKPVKASGKNGKSPALYREYWIIEEKQDISEYIYELNYEIVPFISTDYYRAHIDQYIQDRQWVLLLNDYIKNNDFMTRMSENERSFDIWHREKFLKQEQGKKILKRCGLETAFFNYYRTTEPIAYYTATRQTPQNLLILENKDTFYSMRKCLMHGGEMHTICGTPIGTLIYGAGKGIIAAFSDLDTSGEPYMLAPENRILYFAIWTMRGSEFMKNLLKSLPRRTAHSMISGSFSVLMSGCSQRQTALASRIFRARRRGRTGISAVCFLAGSHSRSRQGSRQFSNRTGTFRRRY